MLLGGQNGTDSIVKTISLITSLANSSVLIKESALRFDLAAYSFSVKVEAFGTLFTDLSVPLGTPEVVVENFQEIWVVLDQGLNLWRH